MEVVNRWRASNLERGAIEDVLADDVEWVVPKRSGVTTLRGIDAVLEWDEGGGAVRRRPGGSRRPRRVSTSRKSGAELEDLGDGRVGSLNRLIYTSKESGEFAYVQTGRLVCTVGDGKMVRYEPEALQDESEVSGDPAQ